MIGQRREVESRGRGAGTQCRLAWSRFKLMETITSPFPRLYSLHPSLSPLQALNREQRERAVDRNANAALVGIQLLAQVEVDCLWLLCYHSAVKMMQECLSKFQKVFLFDF